MKSIKNLFKTKLGLSIMIAVLAVVLIVVLVIAFSPNTPENNAGGQGAEVNDSTVAVQTPYCVLKYPEQWKDTMTVKESTEHGILAETFYAVISEKEYELYTVYFGESMNGDLFGYVPYDGSNIPVYIECYSITGWEALTEEEIMLYYSMMEGVNAVVQSISSTPGYTKP